MGEKHGTGSMPMDGSCGMLARRQQVIQRSSSLCIFFPVLAYCCGETADPQGSDALSTEASCLPCALDTHGRLRRGNCGLDKGRSVSAGAVRLLWQFQTRSQWRVSVCCCTCPSCSCPGLLSSLCIFSTCAINGGCPCTTDPGPRTPCAVVLFFVVLPFPALPCPFLLLSSPAARGCCSPVRPAVASGAIHTCCVVWRCAVCLYWFHRTVLLLQTPPCRLRSNTDIYITLLLPPVSASASASRSASRTASHVALPRSPPYMRRLRRATATTTGKKMARKCENGKM